MILSTLLGAIAMAYTVAGLFFIKFWMKTRDRFFLIFASSFLLEAVNRFFFSLYLDAEKDILVYSVRLISYLIILGAIIDKNRRSS